jgi:ABC-type glycerol-3-phosphate transport system substrate-binding protein
VRCVRLLAAVAPLLLVALAACGAAGDGGGVAGDAAGGGAAGTGDAALARAFEAQASDLEVEGRGTVVRVLADDDEGARHQRFVIRLDSGQTLLVAHNIDVAPRVDGLAEGDVIAFRGVYEWSAEGGTVHWTHRDRAGVHAAGWLRRGGRVYE